LLSNTPFEIPSYLLEKAKYLSPCPMAIAGADNKVVLKSVRLATEARAISPVLIGNADVIQSLSNDIGWNTAGIEIVNLIGEEAISSSAVSLAASCTVKSIMKGHVHTDSLMRFVVKKDTGLRTGRRISHVFHMTVPGCDRVLLITDGAWKALKLLSARVMVRLKAVLLMVHSHSTWQYRLRLQRSKVLIASLPARLTLSSCLISKWEMDYSR
jgi:hypothetical protein